MLPVALPLSLTEIAAFRGIDLGPPFLADNGLEPLIRRELWLDLREHGRRLAEPRDEAFRAFSERGGYPLAHQLAEAPWSYLADQLNETVVKRVVRHEVRSRRWDAMLLAEVFRLACRYAGEAPGPQLFAREVQRVLAAKVEPRRIRQALQLLADSLLLRLIEPLKLRLKRTRGNAKICLADHGLRASWLQEIVPLDPAALEREPHLNMLAGKIAESVTGATLFTISNLDLSYLPAEATSRRSTSSSRSARSGSPSR